MKKTLTERIEMSMELSKILKIKYRGHIYNAGVSYFEFDSPNWVGRIYEPDIDILYACAKGIFPCEDYTKERREIYLARELERSAIFLVGKATVFLEK